MMILLPLVLAGQVAIEPMGGELDGYPSASETLSVTTSCDAKSLRVTVVSEPRGSRVRLRSITSVAFEIEKSEFAKAKSAVESIVDVDGFRVSCLRKNGGFLVDIIDVGDSHLRERGQVRTVTFQVSFNGEVTVH